MAPIILLVLALAVAAQAHMHLHYPAPFNASNNPYTTGPADDRLDYPYNCCGRPDNEPCRGYLKLLGTPEGASVATWARGSVHNFTLEGEGNHYGGSCQVGFSTDKGKTFKVATTYEGDCPHRSGGESAGGQTFNFTVPADLPEGEAVFAWTWVNREQEFNMNCAAVNITAPSTRGSSSAGSSSTPAFSLPPLPTNPSGTATLSAPASASQTAYSRELDHCTCTCPSEGDKCTCVCDKPHAKRSLEEIERLERHALVLHRHHNRLLIDRHYIEVQRQQELEQQKHKRSAADALRESLQGLSKRHLNHRHWHDKTLRFVEDDESGKPRFVRREENDAEQVTAVTVKAKRAMAWSARPDMFMMAMGNKDKCATPHTTAELKYPDPGPDVVQGDGVYPLATPSGNC